MSSERHFQSDVGGIPVIPALRTLRQKERSRPAWAYNEFHPRTLVSILERFNQQQSGKNALRLPANGRAT